MTTPPAQASVAGTIALIGNILGFVEVLLGMKIFICARFVQRGFVEVLLGMKIFICARFVQRMGAEPPTGDTTYPAIKDTTQSQNRKHEDSRLVGRLQRETV